MRRSVLRPGARARQALRGVVALLLLGLTGCQQAAQGGEPGAGPTASGTPSGNGAVFLAQGECSSRGGAGFHEVSCTSALAAARVLARRTGPYGARSRCPARADFVLHLSDARPEADEDGNGSVPRGYACMRNLNPPHPGDPGGGGGPNTLVGDCVSSLWRGEVRETACDGSGDRRPDFEVTAATARRADCPPGTDLYVHLGGESPVGCAVRRTAAG